MSRWKIPLYKIYWDPEDVTLVAEAVRQGMFWAIGPNIEKFETLVADQIGTKYAVAFNSGTSALHAILLAYMLKKGDEVIVPSFTFIATANAALFVGGRPVFADIERETYGLNPQEVQERITPRTKVVMPIHYGGLPCHIKALKDIAQDHKLLLIEDAAESLGATIDGKAVGSFGNAAMFSFCGNKVITTGEGGMIVTDDPATYERLKLARSHGRSEVENYFTSTKTMDYVTLGYNWRISNITAALGISQLKKLPRLIQMRREKAAYLTRRLREIDGITPPDPPSGYHHVYQMYTVRVTEDRRDDLKKHLEQKGIMTKLYFSPVHLTKFYRDNHGFRGGELPVTEELARQVLTLPMYPTLTTEEMDYIIENVKDFMST